MFLWTLRGTTRLRCTCVPRRDPALAGFLSAANPSLSNAEDDAVKPALQNAIGADDHAPGYPVLVSCEDAVANPPESSIENGDADDAIIAPDVDIADPGVGADARRAERPIPPRPQEDAGSRVHRYRRGQHRTLTAMMSGVEVPKLHKVIGLQRGSTAAR